MFYDSSDSDDDYNSNIHIPHTNFRTTNDSEEEDEYAELQNAFKEGRLKPGLNMEVKGKNVYVNDEEALRIYLDKVTTKLDWVERLDITTSVADVSHHLKLEEEVAKQEHDLQGDNIHDDFKRELVFYRQAQTAVLQGLPMLKKHNITTIRPDDYFAEMLKSDDHMDKIRKKVIEKKLERDNIEKLKKLREQKKLGKQIQIQTQKQRHAAKRELMENVRKFKKGKISLDFLDKDGKKSGKEKFTSKVNQKRQAKNEKYGFGGKKSGSKRNTKESYGEARNFNFTKGGVGVEKKNRTFTKKGGDKSMKGKPVNAGKSARPGKKQRVTNKNRKK